MDKNTIEWERLSKKFGRLPFKHKKAISGSISITYAKTIRATIYLSGLRVKDSKKCYSIVFEADTIEKVWKKALNLYLELKEELS